MEIFSDAVVAEDHVGRIAVLIGDDEADDPGPVIGDGGGQVAIVQEIEAGGLAIRVFRKESGLGRRAAAVGAFAVVVSAAGAAGWLLPQLTSRKTDRPAARSVSSFFI